MGPLFFIHVRVRALLRLVLWRFSATSYFQTYTRPSQYAVRFLSGGDNLSNFSNYFLAIYRDRDFRLRSRGVLHCLTIFLIILENSFVR